MDDRGAAYVDGQAIRESPVYLFSAFVLLTATASYIAWLASLPDPPWGMAALVVVPAAALVFLSTWRVSVTVDPERVALHLSPLRRLEVPLREVGRVRVLAGPKKRIRPPKGAIRFQVRTAPGAVLELKDGRTIWVACNYPQLLANAIEALKEREQGGDDATSRVGAYGRPGTAE